jgi:hypothetical protein
MCQTKARCPSVDTITARVQNLLRQATVTLTAARAGRARGRRPGHECSAPDISRISQSLEQLKPGVRPAVHRGTGIRARI